MMMYPAFMRVAMFVIAFLFAFPVYAEPLEEFKARIETAFQQEDKDPAVLEIFYQEGLSEEMQSMLSRTVKRVTRRESVSVSFVPIPEETQLVAIVDGYEYKPNLEVLGYVDLGKNEMGGTTKAPYGQGPDGIHYFTATTKTLVNPDAKPDKQLQMIAIGMDHPPITFEGWCDILQSNNEIIRKELDDQAIGNQTMIMRGQEIKGCELTNTAGRGALSLRLLVDQDVIFEHRIEAPDTVLTYSP